jgi:hypothetical protein
MIVQMDMGPCGRLYIRNILEEILESY